MWSSDERSKSLGQSRNATAGGHRADRRENQWARLALQRATVAQTKTAVPAHRVPRYHAAPWADKDPGDALATVMQPLWVWRAALLVVPWWLQQEARAKGKLDPCHKTGCSNFVFLSQQETSACAALSAAGGRPQRFPGTVIGGGETPSWLAAACAVLPFWRRPVRARAQTRQSRATELPGPARDGMDGGGGGGASRSLTPLPPPGPGSAEGRIAQGVSGPAVLDF